MNNGISVTIPVGPSEHNRRYLDEALASCLSQSKMPDEILLIDDMNGLPQGMIRKMDGVPIRTWKAPWRLGVPAAFNMGVALAENDLVFMLGSDDMLLPGCLDKLWKIYNANKQEDALYWVGIQYSDREELQFQPCNTAAVTKGLWRMTGGFPPELGSGACDAGFISILLGNNMAGRLICVDPSKPLAWYRVSEESDTAGRESWQGVILSTRDLVTRQWHKPEWGRYAN